MYPYSSSFTLNSQLNTAPAGDEYPRDPYVSCRDSAAPVEVDADVDDRDQTAPTREFEAR